MSSSSGSSSPEAGSADFIKGQLTVHSLPRAVLLGSTAVAVGAMRCWNPALAAVGFVGIGVGALGEVFSKRLFPLAPIRRFADLHATAEGISQHHAHEVAELIHNQRFQVGMRTLPGEHGKRPHITIFYPTQTPPCEEEYPCFVPFADQRYSKGFTDYGKAPAIAAKHHVNKRMAFARNASLAPEVAGSGEAGGECLLGSKEHPIIVFSHGLAGHQHMYAAFASDLAASGAIVLALQHCDRSACFALEPPEGKEKLPPSQHKPLKYKPAPSDAERVEEFAFRKNQIQSRRIPEIGHTLRYIAEGKLHDLLHCPAASFDKQFTQANRPVSVALAGHSFGGATVVAASAAHVLPVPELEIGLTQEEMDFLKRRVSIKACVGLDVWLEPINPWLGSSMEASSKMLSTTKKKSSGGMGSLFRGSSEPEPQAAVPPLHFFDSQHWNRWSGHVELEEQFMEAWKTTGAAAAREHKLETDHLTLSAFSDLVNVKAMRRAYTRPDKDRQFVAEWAKESLDFIRASPLW